MEVLCPGLPDGNPAISISDSYNTAKISILHRYLHPNARSDQIRRRGQGKAATAVYAVPDLLSSHQKSMRPSKGTAECMHDRSSGSWSRLVVSTSLCRTHSQ